MSQPPQSPPPFPPGHGPGAPDGPRPQIIRGAAPSPPQMSPPPTPVPPQPAPEAGAPPMQQGYRYQPQSRVIRASETKVLNESAAFLAESQKAAAAIRDEAHTAYEAAKKAGFEDGRREGASEAAQVVMDASFKLQAELAALETTLAEIVMASVERVLGSFDYPERVGMAVRAAIMERQHEWALTLRVAPGRVDEIRSLLQDILGPQFETAIQAVEGDAQLRPDNCVIVSPFGAIEIGIEHQMRALRETLGLLGDHNGRR